MVVLLAETKEACTALHRDLAERPEIEGIQGQLMTIQRLLARQERPKPMPRAILGVWIVGIALVGVALGWTGRAMAPTRLSREGQMLRDVDTFLTERVAALPVEVRQGLDTIYTRAGFQSPSLRKGLKK